MAVTVRRGGPAHLIVWSTGPTHVFACGLVYHAYETTPAPTAKPCGNCLRANRKEPSGEQ